MPLYIGDYLAGTSRLTTEMHGAYLLLIMDYWMNGPLPDNDQALASITRMTPDAWSNARALLVQFFSIENGCWKHKRIEEELDSAYAKKRAAKQKAEKAAAARWGNAPSKGSECLEDATSIASSTSQAMLNECPSPSPSPSINKTLVDSEEPTVDQDEKSPKCPVDKITEIYNRTLPELGCVVKMTDARRQLVRARWLQDAEHQSLEFWEMFFLHIRKSDFLMGRAKSWSASFDWIFKQSNFVKIYEGTYHKEPGA